MEFHGVDVSTQFKRMRELVPEAYRAFLEFDQKAFKDGALPGKTKELMALGIAQITQCPWCIQAHTRKAALAGASDAEIAETTFVAMAMAAGAAWSHGGLALQCHSRTQGLVSVSPSGTAKKTMCPWINEFWNLDARVDDRCSMIATLGP